MEVILAEYHLNYSLSSPVNSRREASSVVAVIVSMLILVDLKNILSKLWSILKEGPCWVSKKSYTLYFAGMGFLLGARGPGILSCGSNNTLSNGYQQYPLYSTNDTNKWRWYRLFLFCKPMVNMLLSAIQLYYCCDPGCWNTILVCASGSIQWLPPHPLPYILLPVSPG